MVWTNGRSHMSFDSCMGLPGLSSFMRFMLSLGSRSHFGVSVSLPRHGKALSAIAKMREALALRAGGFETLIPGGMDFESTWIYTTSHLNAPVGSFRLKGARSEEGDVQPVPPHGPRHFHLYIMQHSTLYYVYNLYTTSRAHNKTLCYMCTLSYTEYRRLFSV